MNKCIICSENYEHPTFSDNNGDMVLLLTVNNICSMECLKLLLDTAEEE